MLAHTTGRYQNLNTHQSECSPSTRGAFADRGRWSLETLLPEDAVRRVRDLHRSATSYDDGRRNRVFTAFIPRARTLPD